MKDKKTEPGMPETPSRRDALRRSTGLAAAAAFIASGAAVAPLLASPARASSQGGSDDDDQCSTCAEPEARPVEVSDLSGVAMSALRQLDGQSVRITASADGAVTLATADNAHILRLRAAPAATTP